MSASTEESTTQEPATQEPSPKENEAPKQQKRKLTAAQIRKLRKLRVKERQRNSDKRLDYIYNRISKDDLSKKDDTPVTNQQNNTQNANPNINNTNNTGRINDAFNTNNPFMNHTHMPNMFGGNPFLTPNSSSSALDPNIGVNNMVDSVLTALGANTNNNQTPEQRRAKRKHEEKVTKYETYAHHIFCVLFVLLLAFLPYDITILNYNLSSDSWTYFISFELILFSVFYGYKQYLQRKYSNPNQTANNDGMNGAGQLMTMIGANIGASFLGGGNQMSTMIQKWIERGLMLWSYIEMLRQLISDLCLVLFLWIVLTFIKTLFGGYID